MPKTLDRVESLLQTCVSYGADETKLRAAYARQPASLSVDDRIVAAWSEATGITAPHAPPAPPDAPPVVSPVPLGPPVSDRIVSGAHDSRSTLRDWVIGSVVVFVPAAFLFTRCF